MRIVDMLRAERIVVFLEGTSKPEVIDRLVDVTLAGLPQSEWEEVRAAVHQREGLTSTGIGAGVAVPHARLAAGGDLVLALGLTREPIDFESIDGQPVRILFLVLSPEDKAGLQLRLLARISRLMHNDALREGLMRCRSVDEVIEAFTGYESKHFG